MSAYVRVQLDNDTEISYEEDNFSEQGHGESIDDDSEAGMEEDVNKSSSGFANAMAKVLGKRVPNSKNPVLSKGKTDREILMKKNLPVNMTDGDSYFKGDCHRAAKNLRHGDSCHVKPDPLNLYKEKSLKEIATRGVVQLFNAVRQQQSVLDDRLTDAGSSQRRRDKVMKSVSKKSFMELLGNNQSTKSSKKTRDDEPMSGGGGGAKWSVLRDDFMMTARTKDWRHTSLSEGEDNPYVDES